MLFQKGFAHLALIVLTLLGIGLGIYLVRTKTDLFPNAQDAGLQVSQTAFHLFIDKKYSVSDSGGEITHINRESGGSSQIVPNRNWFYPGEEIRVNVAVSSDVDSANTFSAIVDFPNDLLEVTDIKQDSQGTHHEVGGPIPQPYFGSSSSATIPSEGRGIGAGCKVGGCSGESCVDVNSEDFVSVCGHDDEGWARVACVKAHSTCEKQKSGQCGWTKTPDLAKCIETANAKPENCAQVVTRACKFENVRCLKEPCSPRQECRDFPSQCDIPPGWDIVEDGGGFPKDCNPYQENIQCKKGYYCKPNSVCNSDNSACTEVGGGTCVIASPSVPVHPKFVQDYFIRFWLPDTGFDNAAGRITLSGGVSGGGIMTAPPSKPVMATITFKAKKPGEAYVYIAEESLILRNSDATNILTNRNKVAIQVQEKPAKPVVIGDLDGDGIVGFTDFSILLSNWGSDNPKADINGNGKVDVFDFSIMLSNWIDRK